VKSEGPALGIAAEPYDAAGAFRASSDAFVKANHDKYCQMFETLLLKSRPQLADN
jgi:hypothetical protein